MSLARTALRLGAIEALRSHPAIEACCPGRIYDSRVGDFDHREPVPVIIVTTEELHGEPWNEQNGGEPFDDSCDLVLEIAMTQLVEDEASTFLLTPGTDSEMEAMLDLLEESASCILTLGRPMAISPRSTPAGKRLQEVVIRRVSRRTSSRFSSDQTGEKLAIHLLTFRVELKGEQIDSYAIPPGPFGVLPDPLRTIANAMAEGSSGYQTCQLIAERLGLNLTPAPSPPSQPVVVPDPEPGTLPTEVSIPLSQVP